MNGKNEIIQWWRSSPRSNLTFAIRQLKALLRVCCVMIELLFWDFFFILN